MKVVLFILISLLLSGCIKEDRELNNHIILKDNNIEVYSDIYLYDLFDIKDIELITENELLNTKKLGNKEYVIEYKYEDKIYEYVIKYNIVDTEAPRYFGSTNKTILKNYEGNLCNLIMYGDNYDGNVICSIDGYFNLEETGTYKLIYNLTDNSNNTSKVNVTLNVVEKKNSTTSSGNIKKTLFSDIYEKYKNDNNEIGIDVSKWQGEIDFEKVKNAGASFVMIRLGVQTSKNGEIYIDKYFEDNIKNAKKYGLKVGVYLYSMATSSKEAIEQANYIIDTLDKETLDLPITFDWENWSKWHEYKLSFYEINDIANKFIETVEKNGYKGMLYSSKYYLENIWNNKNNNLVWLAHYTDNTSYKGKYMMWQLSNTGRIDGINGDVDIDILYGE